MKLAGRNRSEATAWSLEKGLSWVDQSLRSCSETRLPISGLDVWISLENEYW